MKGKMGIVVMVGVMTLTLLVGGMSFALDLPAGVKRDEALLAAALDMAIEQFTMLKDMLTAAAQDVPLDQQAAMSQAIAIVDQRLQQLDHIDVYFATEDAPGAAFDTIYDYYVNNGVTFQNVSGDEVAFAIMDLPPELVPQETKDTITTLAEAGKIRGAIEAKSKSRISLLTVYVNPATFEVIERTTVIIAVDK